MARQQKPITVKLNKEQLIVLDRIVELGEFNGRSHAIREMLLPGLEAGRVAINETFAGKAKSAFAYKKAWQNFTDRMDTINKNAKQLPRDSKGQALMDIDGNHEQLLPEIVPA